MDLAVPPAAHFQPVTIVAIRDEAPDVKTFFLQPVSGAPLAYQAGQFLTLVFNRNNREERRSYSVSSSPAAGDPLAITVKRVENGAHSRGLIDYARTGDVMMCAGVSGLFTLPDQIDAYPQVLMFAAGIGITPIFSLIKELLHREDHTRMVVFYSNRSKKTTVFYEELTALEALHPDRLKIEWLFSDAKNLLRARITKAILPQLLKQHLIATPSATLCYICGPEDYRWLLHLLLEEAGILPANIRREIFAPGRMPLPSLPPDTESHLVTIELRDKTYQLQVQYPQTILNAAKKAGIPMPYSCEAGRCATCIGRCRSGSIWMAYNEVLTANDLKNGLALTCTGYPVGGDVVLTF